MTRTRLVAWVLVLVDGGGRRSPDREDLGLADSSNSPAIRQQAGPRPASTALGSQGSRRPPSIQLPIGEERDFKGIIDLIGYEGVYLHRGRRKGKEIEIPVASPT
jgi:hypothetical protein